MGAQVRVEEILRHLRRSSLTNEKTNNEKCRGIRIMKTGEN